MSNTRLGLISRAFAFAGIGKGRQESCPMYAVENRINECTRVQIPHA